MTLSKLLESTKEGSRLLREASEDARPACVAAVRQMEAALVEALGGETLKGLPVLAGDGPERFYGARARGRLDKKLYEKPVLVICPDGRLRVATFASERVTTHDVDDAELLAEDVDAVARSLGQVLRQHLETAAKATARYEALGALARKLDEALAPDDDGSC